MDQAPLRLGVVAFLPQVVKDEIHEIAVDSARGDREALLRLRRVLQSVIPPVRSTLIAYE